MPERMKRRSFLIESSAKVAAATTLAWAGGAPRTSRAGEFTGRIRKAVKYSMFNEKIPAEDKLKILQDLGFDGVEPRAMLNPNQAAEVRALQKASEKLDFPIHGVVNSSNPDISGAIDQAAAYGATSVLHVVRYDKSIGYMENYKQTQDIIRKAIGRAEQKKVSILIENVWATFLIEPLGMARYIDELDSPYVQVYFDVGNVVRWGWPQHWIEVLGQRVKKLDIKEYDLGVAMNEGMRKAFAPPLGEGSVEWDKVRAELKKIGYEGWATAEVRGGDRKRMEDIASEMNRVLDL